MAGSKWSETFSFPKERVIAPGLCEEFPWHEYEVHTVRVKKDQSGTLHGFASISECE